MTLEERSRAHESLERCADLLRVAPLALVVVLLDQATKFLVQSRFLPGDQLPVVPGFFNLTLTYNPGVAFGLFAGLPEEIRSGVLTVTILVAFTVLLAFLFGEYGRTTAGRTGLGLILGGAIGNIVDRLYLGKVVDFLLVYYQDWHWPAFNVADSAICIGVGVLLVFGSTGQRPELTPEGS